MRPHGSAKTLEHRRRRAVELLDSGLTMEEVSHRVGCSKASVCRWKQALAQGGAKALTAKPVPGRPRKLLEEQCRQLLALLLQGAVAYGYPVTDQHIHVPPAFSGPANADERHAESEGQP